VVRLTLASRMAGRVYPQCRSGLLQLKNGCEPDIVAPRSYDRDGLDLKLHQIAWLNQLARQSLDAAQAWMVIQVGMRPVMGLFYWEMVAPERSIWSDRVLSTWIRHFRGRMWYAE
jgi:hypothetical protein